jgi:hypothetical protein
MGPYQFVFGSFASVLAAAAVTMAVAQSQPAGRSEPLPPPQQQQQQQSAPPKPYKAVTVSVPAPISDPSFEAFRKQLAEIAEKKDRKALAALVANNFFWLGEQGDKAARGRPGIENLARAMALDARDGSGWEMLEGYAADATASPFPERTNTICAPGEPQFNEQEFEQLAEATGAPDEDWAFPLQPGLEMRAGPQLSSPVVETLGMHFIRVLEDDSAPPAQDTPMLRVAAPSGKVGYVPIDAIGPLVSDQLCYVKQGGAWRIAGFIGGEQ